MTNDKYSWRVGIQTFAFFAVLAGQTAFSSGRSSALDAIDLDQFLDSSTRTSEYPYRNPALTLRPNLIAATERLKEFPAQEAILIDNRRAADRLCNENFSGFFYWWSCGRDLTGIVINRRILELALEVSRSDHYQLADDVVLSGANRYFQADALEMAKAFVVLPLFPELVQLMADSRFDLGVLPLCNSRYNAVANLATPMMSARRLNQRAIFDCLGTIRNRSYSIGDRVRVQSCKFHPELSARTACLRQIHSN